MCDKKRILSARWCWLVLLLLAACGGGTPGAVTRSALPTATGAPPQAGTLAPAEPRLVVAVNARQESGRLDKDRLLNGTVGAAAPLVHGEWLQGAYPALAEAGIRRVRLDHLTDDAYYRVVSRDKAGQLVFDFSRLDAVVLPLFALDIQPFFCLSYTPGALLTASASASDLSSGPGLPVSGEPQPVEAGAHARVPDLEEWQQVVRALVGHYAQAGHTGLYWEVWNEPDLAQNFSGDARQYVEMYVKTAQAVKQADPSARVGGPADSGPASPTAQLAPLLAAVHLDPSIPLDFVSYHKYGDSNGDGQPPFDLEWGYDIVDFALKRSQLAEREVFVSAWSLTPLVDGGPGALNDSHRAASEAAVMLYNALKYPNLKGVFYNSLIDGANPAQVLNGDMGLLTVNYHRKAIYQLFQMISWMGDARLMAEVSGAGSQRAARYALAARAADGQVAVLAWNNTPEAVILDLAVNGLAATGNWQVARYQIDAQHAGYPADFVAGLRGLTLSPAELLAPLNVTVLPVTARYELATRLPPESVALFVLAPPESELPGWVAPTRPARNVAAGQAVSVSSTLDAPGWNPAAAVDEITLSLPGALGWSSERSAQAEVLQWIAVDLGQPYRVQQVVLTPRSDEGRWQGPGLGDGFPVDFRIQGALLPNQWSDLEVYTGYGPAGGPQSFTLSAGPYQYLRVMATRLGQIAGRPGEFYFQLAEMQVIEAAE